MKFIQRHPESYQTDFGMISGCQVILYHCEVHSPFRHVLEELLAWISSTVQEVELHELHTCDFTVKCFLSS